MNKRKSQINHSIKRSCQRYGVEYSKSDIEAMINIIIKNVDVKSIKQTDSRTLKRFEYNGNTVYCVYDRRRKSIATFLTKEQWEDEYYILRNGLDD